MVLYGDKIVVDANIFFSSLLKPGGTNRQILTHFSEYLCTSEFVFQELKKYDDLFKKKNIDYNAFLSGLLVGSLNFYPESFFYDSRLLLKEYMESIDPKDLDYVALAYKLKIPLWTHDKKLQNEVTCVKVVDTGRMMNNFL